MSTPNNPRLCRFGGCRSYGKMDGYCLIHIKDAAKTAPPTTPLVAPVITPSLQPLRIASPPPLVAPLVMSPRAPATMQITQLPPVNNGRWQCFVPQCSTLAALGLPFCPEHEHATLTVDIKPRRKRKSPKPNQTPRARQRLAPESCEELYRQQLDVSEHAQILATLART
ncbi:hypothetical protein ACHHYP_10943 [Achlya hypogyna]|uniref:Uncharacterized protein n=1 Tax=Achlya hypogyna TaxID=1202772 RepID=A0A1V9YKA7_ACHHY|nr:hypothetical protein ACHHYP_10943 [Achlya hypogyna]